MKFITRHLVYFTLVLILLTILFRYTLSNALEAESWMRIIVSALSYGLLAFIFGWIYGKKDYESLPLYDIGFRFHFATYIVVNSIAILWHTLGLQSQYEELSYTYSTMLFWGLSLILHFVFYLYSRKNAYKGINKSDLFE